VPEREINLAWYTRLPLLVDVFSFLWQDLDYVEQLPAYTRIQKLVSKRHNLEFATKGWHDARYATNSCLPCHCLLARPGLY
jgi:hypothetical protein